MAEPALRGPVPTYLQLTFASGEVWQVQPPGYRGNYDALRAAAAEIAARAGLEYREVVQDRNFSAGGSRYT